MKLTPAQFEQIEQRRSAEDLKFLLEALKEDGVVEIKRGQSKSRDRRFIETFGQNPE